MSLLRHRPRQRLAVDRRHRAGRDRLPGFAARGLVLLGEGYAVEQRAALRGTCAGMAELHGRHAAELLHEIRDAPVLRDLVVAIKASAFVRFAPAVLDRRLFIEDDACAADRVTAHMDDVPVGRRAVRGLVLAHRRDDDAVARRDALQRERFEQFWSSHIAIVPACCWRSLKIDRCADLYIKRVGARTQSF